MIIDEYFLDHQLEIDKLQSDYLAEKNATEKLELTIEKKAKELADAMKLQRLADNEENNYEDEKKKLHSINEQLLVNTITLKRLRDDLKRKLSILGLDLFYPCQTF